MNTRISTLLLGALLAGYAFAEESETKLTFSQLPPAVQQTAKTQSEGYKIRGYSKELENGKTYYEIEMLQNGKTKDLLADREGKIVETEEQIDVSTLPQEVKSGLQQQAAAAKIVKVEKVTKGESISYEAVISSADKKREIAVASDGSKIKAD